MSISGSTVQSLGALLQTGYQKRRAKQQLAPADRSRAVRLAPGLTRAEAQRRASQRSPGDFRGFTYDRRTGKAVLT